MAGLGLFGGYRKACQFRGQRTPVDLAICAIGAWANRDLDFDDGKPQFWPDEVKWLSWIRPLGKSDLDPDQVETARERLETATRKKDQYLKL